MDSLKPGESEGVLLMIFTSRGVRGAVLGRFVRTVEIVGNVGISVSLSVSRKK